MKKTQSALISWLRIGCLLISASGIAACLAAHRQTAAEQQAEIDSWVPTYQKYYKVSVPVAKLMMDEEYPGNLFHTTPCLDVQRERNKEPTDSDVRQVGLYVQGGVPKATTTECVCRGITYDSYLQWSSYSSRFSCSLIEGWLDANVSSPNTADSWSKLNVSAAETGEYQRRSVAPREFEEWKAAGLDCNPSRVASAEAFVRAGYSRQRTMELMSAGLTEPSQVHNYERGQALASRRHELIKRNCPSGKVDNEYQLLTANPYNTVGRCYAVLGVVSQWLGPNSALVSFYDRTVWIESSEPLNGGVIEIVGRGAGAFSYTSAEGGLVTVARVRLLFPY